jgi:hypothetical protein
MRAAGMVGGMSGFVDVDELAGTRIGCPKKRLGAALAVVRAARGRTGELETGCSPAAPDPLRQQR